MYDYESEAYDMIAADAEEDERNPLTCGYCTDACPERREHDGRGCLGCDADLCRECAEQHEGCRDCVEVRDAANPIDLLVAVVYQTRAECRR